MMINQAVVAATATFCKLCFSNSQAFCCQWNVNCLSAFYINIKKSKTNQTKNTQTTTTKPPQKSQDFIGLCTFQESQICGLRNWDWCKSHLIDAPRYKTYSSTYRSNCTSFLASWKNIAILGNGKYASSILIS